MMAMQVLGLTLDQEDGTPVLILRQRVAQGEHPALLPIWMGWSEATSLAIAASNRHLSRPMTQDIMVEAIQAMGGRFITVAIDSVNEGIFYAHVDIQNGQNTSRLDCRPSDAVLIALRVGLDVMIDENLLNVAQAERFRPWAPDYERRPLDSLDALICQASQMLLTETGQLPPVLEQHLAAFQPEQPAEPEIVWEEPKTDDSPESKEEMTELLRTLEPPSKKFM